MTVPQDPIVKMVTHGLGWRPDVPDQRDLRYKAPYYSTVLPSKVDLRNLCPEVTDQGQLGSCTAHAIIGGYRCAVSRQGRKGRALSPLFLYYCERWMENTIESDAGAMIRTGMKVANKLGIAFESTWPYIIKKFKKQPAKAAYVSAEKNQAIQYEQVHRTLVRDCLAGGFPVVIGFSVYESFYHNSVANSGEMLMPMQGESLLGGHAVLVVGYDDATARYTVRNSWGERWGDKGYFYMPYEYLTNPGLSADFWTMKLVE